MEYKILGAGMLIYLLSGIFNLAPSGRMVGKPLGIIALLLVAVFFLAVVLKGNRKKVAEANEKKEENRRAKELARQRKEAEETKKSKKPLIINILTERYISEGKPATEASALAKTGIDLLEREKIDFADKSPEESAIIARSLLRQLE